MVLPLTTPALAFARLRRHSTSPPDLVLRGPDGTRGWYAIPLAAVAGFAAPSLFDRAVLAAVSAAGTPSPQSVAAARRAASVQGLAGRWVAAREVERRRGEQAEVATALVALVARLSGRDEAALARGPMAGDALVAFVQDNRALLEQVARVAALDTAAFVSALHALASAVALARRLETTIQRLRTFAAAVSDLDPLCDGERTALAFVQGAATATAEAASALQRGFQEATLVPMRSIRAAASAEVAWRASLDLASWVLDGWPLLLSIWDAAGTSPPDRLAALWLIGRSLPPLPRELEQAVPGVAISATVHDRWPDTPARLRGRGTALRQALLERLLGESP